MKKQLATLCTLFSLSISMFAATPDKVINGHKFVDLGLPSGLLWAEANVGASTAIESGDYYAWGEVSTKRDYSWPTYAFKNVKHYEGGVLKAQDDVATTKWGQGCRIPTDGDFKELCKSCKWKWQETGTRGYLVTGPNGNSIFLPAAGQRDNDNDHDRQTAVNYGHNGSYWASTDCTDPSYNTHAVYLTFGEGGINVDHVARYLGFPIRAVADK